MWPSLPERAPHGDVRRGGRSISAPSWASELWAAVQSRGSQTPGPLTPITTVSSPLNLGMNLSPRRISASLRGRNRHITLMLHSAGSAISAGGREGARGWVGARGSAPRGSRPLTAPPAARPPPAASDEASQQVIANSAGWAAPAAPRPDRWAVYQPPARLAADLPSLTLPWPCDAPPAHLPATTRPRTRRCAGTKPRRAQTSRAAACSAILHQHHRAPPPPAPAPLPRPPRPAPGR